MEKKPSLLNQLKSKYILQDILSLAYGDIKSVLKLIKYNKNLINRIDINIKDYYNYKYKVKIEKKLKAVFLFLMFLHIILIFIPILIYIICFFTIGTFNDKNLKEGYDKKKKSFVDFMDNYILLVYFLLIITSYILNILFNLSSKIYLKALHRGIYLLIFGLVDLFHYVLHWIKYIFTQKIMKKELSEKASKGKTSILTWFYAFDIALLFLLDFSLPSIFGASMILCEKEEFDDIKIYSLLEINGIKINEFKLESEFDGLDEKSKNEFVFKKENVENYRYKLNENQINTINKINDIRKNNNIPELKFDKKEIIPHFMINPKLQLVFHPKENIYKISGNSYIFKYDKDEFQNLLNKKEIINIIKIDYLNEINIVEQNDTEFIFIFNNRPENENRIQENNNIRKPNINIGNINIPHIDIINTEDKFVNLSVNEISERDISEKRNISKKK